jgi:cardiolipin synthase A/B
MSPVASTQTVFQWLPSGREAFAAMLVAIEQAKHTLLLEMYTFCSQPLGEQFRDALTRAVKRGLSVRVLVDAMGSLGLSTGFWKPFMQAGGEFRWFNPIRLSTFTYRNHRKALVCDGTVAIFGGINIAPEYDGDGVTSGWRDLAMRAEGPLAAELAEAFRCSWEIAGFEHKALQRFRPTRSRQASSAANWRLLLGGPGFGYNYLKSTLAGDLAHARHVQILCAYFLPTWRIRRELEHVCRRGGRVQLILAGKSDVRLSQLATRKLYRPLLKKGIEIYEYEPQILHAKLFIVDEQVYVGSSNLDTRSLNINYELLVRITEPRVVAEGRGLFEQALGQSRAIDYQKWKKSRTLWAKLTEQWAYYLLARVDPYVAGLRLPLFGKQS